MEREKNGVKEFLKVERLHVLRHARFSGDIRGRVNQLHVQSCLVFRSYLESYPSLPSEGRK
jgi:hypothetical protein